MNSSKSHLSLVNGIGHPPYSVQKAEAIFLVNQTQGKTRFDYTTELKMLKVQPLDW